MTDYERGLEKLGLSLKLDIREGHPAFAWRVLEAFLNRWNAPDIWLGQCAEGRFCVLGNPEEYSKLGYRPEVDIEGKTLAAALYAAVEILGGRATDEIFL